MSNQSFPMSYSVAILADIHGNYVALQAVLEDLKSQHYNQLVIAGDLVLNGPQPAETLDCIRSLRVPILYGEADVAVVSAQNDNPVARWTAEKIGVEGVSFLETLPFSHTISPLPESNTENDLLIVHATPTKVSDFLILQPNDHDPRCSSLTHQDEVITMIGDTRANMIVHGHLHYASFGQVGARQIFSIGSVGYPFDLTQHAAYALVMWDGNKWRLKHRRVVYDYEKVITQIVQSGQPFSEVMIKRIREAKWFPQQHQ